MRSRFESFVGHNYTLYHRKHHATNVLKLSCSLDTNWVDWHMIFGLEQEGGTLIAPMALAHSPHPIDNRSRNRHRNLWVGWCVSPWWTLFPSWSSVLIYIHMHFLNVFWTYIYIYIYIYKYNFSVIQYWWSCTPSHSRGVRSSWVECHLLFSLFHQLCLALWWK